MCTHYSFHLKTSDISSRRESRVARVSRLEQNRIKIWISRSELEESFVESETNIAGDGLLDFVIMSLMIRRTSFILNVIVITSKIDFGSTAQPSMNQVNYILDVPSWRFAGNKEVSHINRTHTQKLHVGQRSPRNTTIVARIIINPGYLFLSIERKTNK